MNYEYVCVVQVYCLFSLLNFSENIIKKGHFSLKGITLSLMSRFNYNQCPPDHKKLVKACRAFSNKAIYIIKKHAISPLYTAFY